MSDYTFTVCTNDETLRGSRSIDAGLLEDACIDACEAGTAVFEEMIGKLPESDDCYDLEGERNFADWNGGRMSAAQYFRVAGAIRRGHVVIKCDDSDTEIPQELATIAEAMHKAISDAIDDNDATDCGFHLLADED